MAQLSRRSTLTSFISYQSMVHCRITYINIYIYYYTLSFKIFDLTCLYLIYHGASLEKWWSMWTRFFICFILPGLSGWFTKFYLPEKGEQMTFTVNMICWKSGCLIKIGLPCRMKLTYLSVRQHLIWQNTCALSKNSWKLYKLMGFPHAVTARDSMLLRWQGHNLQAFWLQCRTNSSKGRSPSQGTY